MTGKNRRALRWGLWGATAVVVLLASVLVIGQIARAQLAANTPAPGLLVDLGGYRLHLRCEGVGPLTVLLEAGVNEFSLQWYRLQPLLAAHTRTCAYDRAGLGWSDPPLHEPTIMHAVADLHRLLQLAGEEGPFVLVGHSYGGLLVRMYQQTHPDQVRGIVLVDAASEHQAARIPGYAQLVDATARQFRSVDTMASLGFIALATDSIPPGKLEGKALTHYRALLAAGSFFRGAAGETSALLANLQTVIETPPLSVVPTVVISRGKPDPLPGMNEQAAQELEQTWTELQAELSAVLRAEQHIRAEQSGHHIQLDQPDLVYTAVRDLLHRLAADPLVRQ